MQRQSPEDSERFLELRQRGRALEDQEDHLRDTHIHCAPLQWYDQIHNFEVLEFFKELDAVSQGGW